ncbi:MAG TPA: hypothetical protein PKD12_04715 [Nitrospira sp.]|nr:hypothetical protein [Nitrospira sp.]
MTTKFHIKMGLVEVDYDGSEEFLKAELPALLTAVSDLYKQSGLHNERERLNNVGEASEEDELDNGSGLKMSTTTIAGKLSVQSGSDLTLAAGIKLGVVHGQGTFTRKEILKEMQSATGFYKASYGANLSKSLLTLVKDKKFNEQSKGVYSLVPSAKAELKAKLAN